MPPATPTKARWRIFAPHPGAWSDIGAPAHPRWIVFPRWKAGAAAQLTSHSKAAAFLHLASHAFNYSLLGSLGFQRAAALMDACDCWDFEYSQLADALRVFRELQA